MSDSRPCTGQNSPHAQRTHHWDGHVAKDSSENAVFLIRGVSFLRSVHNRIDGLLQEVQQVRLGEEECDR